MAVDDGKSNSGAKNGLNCLICQKKRRMTCVDCPHFKMLKGWKYAYCSMGQLIASWNYSGKDRLFKWLSHKRTLIERAPRIKALKGCKLLRKV